MVYHIENNKNIYIFDLFRPPFRFFLLLLIWNRSKSNFCLNLDLVVLLFRFYNLIKKIFNFKGSIIIKFNYNFTLR